MEIINTDFVPILPGTIVLIGERATNAAESVPAVIRYNACTLDNVYVHVHVHAVYMHLCTCMYSILMYMEIAHYIQQLEKGERREKHV